MQEPQVIWSQRVEGKRPGVTVGEDRLLFHYETGPDEQTVTELQCLDLAGDWLWSRPGYAGRLALPGGRFLVSSPAGESLLIDGRGELVRRGPTVPGGGPAGAARHGGLLVLADAGNVWGCDLDLNPLWRLLWPGAQAVIGCFADGAFYWAEGDELKFRTRGGRSGTFARLDEGLVAGAADRFERATNRPCRADWPFRRWQVSFDAGRGQFLLGNFMPHVVLCLDASGRPRWCRCLGPACCGGPPYPLPGGGYAASGGCNGVLSWLGEDGTLLFQSRPHEGKGLASAYSDRLRVMPWGTVLATGGPGLVAYGRSGTLLWRRAQRYSDFHYDPATRALVGCSWRSRGPDGTDLSCVESRRVAV